jgi:sphingomyelin phosphodiesterase acid-like 3
MYSVLLLVLGCSLVSADSHKGYFWILNDLHYDPTYPDEAKSSCNEVVNPAGEFGDFMCDPPWSLMKSAVTAIKNHGESPDFIVWLGDYIPHLADKSLLTEEFKLEIITNLTQLLSTTFPDIQILPVLGNHDYHPTNMLPGGPSPLYDKLAEIWKPWLQDISSSSGDAYDTFKTKGGFYRKSVGESTHAFVLNTNLYNRENTVANSQDDPGSQYVWLRAELDKVRSAGQKAHIFMHIPVGTDEQYGKLDYTDKHNTKVHSVLRDYSDVIGSVHAGHSHMDTFKIIYKDGNPVATLFKSPSVTPWRDNYYDGKFGYAHNPAIRKVTFDRGSSALMDYMQYSLDLEAANKEGGADDWARLYSFTEVYGVEDMSPQSVQKVYKNLGSSSSSFQKYYDFNTVNVKQGKPACDCKCKSQYLCSIGKVDAQDFADCIKEEEYCPETGSGNMLSSGLLNIKLAALSAALLVYYY